jgi:hypothetical protein
MKCPYCKKPIKAVDSSVIYGEGATYGVMYVCSDYPQCDSYSSNPKSLVDYELRELRKDCHRLFDASWKSGEFTRRNRYNWLSRHMKLSRDRAHIAMFRVEECKKLLTLINK